MKTSRHSLPLAVMLATLLPAGAGLAQSGPPPIPVIWLDSYSFQQTNFDSDMGYAPLNFTNVVNVDDCWGNAVMLDTTNLQPAFLQYNIVETNGFVNMDLGAGALLACVVSDWASADTNQNGQGPGELGYLLAAGDFSSGSPQGLWAIYVDAGGTNIYFGGVSNSVVTTYVCAPISWASNSYHEIAVTYSTNSMLYLDGQWAATGGPVTVVPDSTNAVYIGSDNSGYEQFRGEFLYLEFDATNLLTYIGSNWFIEDWAWDTNSYDTWLNPSVGGFQPDLSSSTSQLPPTPTNAFNTNYLAYTNFWMSITNTGTEAQVRLINPCLGLTYVILTNTTLAPLSSTNWQPWVTLTGSGTIMATRPLKPASNTLYFCAELIPSTGANGLPDWWCMAYFNTLNVDPYADPDGDGLCNLTEYLLGTNPTNAHSISRIHNDAQAMFLGYVSDTACRYHIATSNGPDTNTLLVTIWPTQIGTNYQIYSKDASVTNGAWRVETNFLGANTATTVAIPINGRSLSLIGGDGEDPDGDGLPSGYEVLATLTDPYLPDTGLTGTPDGYKDPDGDGYVNLEEYYNGTDPHVFDTPAAPQNVVEDYSSGGDTETICWQAVQGPVLDYIIYDGYGNPIATNPPTQLSLTIANQNSSWFGVQAIYAKGSTSTNYGDFYTQHPGMAQAALAHGPGGNIYLFTSAAMSNATGYNFRLGCEGTFYPEVAFYMQNSTWNSPTPPSSAYVPASQFTNGVAVLTGAQMSLCAGIYVPACLLTPQAPGNATWATTYAQNPGLPSQPGLTSFNSDPFIDGTEAMKQNVRFLLRVGNDQSFDYQLNGAYTSTLHYPPNYVFSSYYYGAGPYRAVDHFAPFEDNYFFCNFAFNSNLIDNNGYLETGFVPWNWLDIYYQTNVAQFEFPTYSYVTSSNQAPIPGILSSNQAPWVGCFQGDPGDFGAYASGGSLVLSGSAVNIYGLPYKSLELTLSNSGGIQFATLSPGNNVSDYNGLPFYAGAAEPELRTVDYYFANEIKDPLPENNDGSFDVTNTTPLIVGSVGASMIVAGYAKQAVLNGYNNVFAYLGQYFTNAYVTSNGVITTNPAGIVSEYGEFFPTVPGHIALLTKPDPDQTNIQGVCELDIIRLSLDVNHDGIMDETFTGPDNTSSSLPYVFWANNDYDRWHSPLIDGTIEDDLETAAQPDCNYTDNNGNRAIPCPRDLEDYARLWVSGVSNTLSRLPVGGTVTLSWNITPNPYNGILPYTGNPAIDIFQAADVDGGTGYLTNLATASNQINNALCQYMGRLGLGSNIQLNASTFNNNWAGDHYIWCGVTAGTGELDLTIFDANSNVLAQSTQIIQIQDIKQMYERWTVGDAPGVSPMSNAVPAQDNFSPGYPTTPFQYFYDPAYDTNDTYIVYVHGWNTPSWEKDRFAETMYKRLYWQGYQGRFGSFRWPTTQLGIVPPTYNPGELAAWQSGAPLESFLAGLNSKYPGNVYVLAHSMGNVVTGEALRLAGTNTIVNTYVASQAAVSARAYDNTIPADITNVFALDGYAVKTPDTEGHYYTNGAPSYFNGIGGAAFFVDYYNQGDWALNLWVGNQAEKPQLPYFYVAPSSSYPSGYIQTFPFRSARNLSFGTNTYEIFAMCVQSYSYALGAETSIADRFSETPSINLHNAPFNFGDQHPGHSEQFRFDNMTTAGYWGQLLTSFGLK